MTANGPPRLATRLVRLLLHADDRDDVLGDFRERYWKHVQRMGAASAPVVLAPGVAVCALSRP